MAESPKEPGVEDQLHAAAKTARASTFGNPDQPPQGAINTKGNPASLTDPGPQNATIGGQFVKTPPTMTPPLLSPSALIVSSLDLNPRLQTGRGFSRFFGHRLTP